MYLSSKAKPSIAHVVFILSRYTNNPSRIYSIALKKKNRFLKSTIPCCQRFVGYPAILIRGIE